jgi:hypothetical protein
MSEYLTYTLWQQREQRMPHELEHQRVVQERLREQEQEAELAQQPTVSTEPVVADAPGLGRFRDDEYVLVDE